MKLWGWITCVNLIGFSLVTYSAYLHVNIPQSLPFICCGISWGGIRKANVADVKWLNRKNVNVNEPFFPSKQHRMIDKHLFGRITSCHWVFPFQLCINKFAEEHEDTAPSAVCQVTLQNREGSFSSSVFLCQIEYFSPECPEKLDTWLTSRSLLCRTHPEVSISLPFLSLLSSFRYSLGKYILCSFN